METDKANKLKPPKRLRPVTPRVCATCRFFVLENGEAYCSRPSGKDFGDAGDMLQWFHVCERYKSYLK